MSNYDYDNPLDDRAQEFFDKRFFSECTEGEQRAILEIDAARKRLRKVDAFIQGLR